VDWGEKRTLALKREFWACAIICASTREPTGEISRGAFFLLKEGPGSSERNTLKATYVGRETRTVAKNNYFYFLPFNNHGDVP